MSLSEPQKRTNKSFVSYHTSNSGSLRKTKARERESFKQKTILQFSKQIPLMFEGIDVTPVSLSPYLYEGGRERQISVLDAMIKDTSILKNYSLQKSDSQKFQTNILLQKQEMDTGTATYKSVVTSAYFADDIVISKASKSEFSQEGPDFLFSLESMDDIVYEPAIPQEISLILTETITIPLLEMRSCTVSKISEEANDVDEDNKLYDYLTKGKGRNRKLITVEIQTVPILTKVRDTSTQRIKMKNDFSYVSGWDMYDVYNEKEEQLILEHDDNDTYSISDHELNEEHKLNDEASLDSYRMPTDDKQLIRIVRSKAFQDALTVIERILGNNCYLRQQKRYKGLQEPNIFREDVTYKSRLELLWICSNEDTDGRCVTRIAFNTANEDIMAVAHGKYLYNDPDCGGLIMIWNIKNPQQPERRYRFSSPVTSVAFAQTNPNLLAVGCYNGQLKILDISKRELFEVRGDSSFFESIWSVLWFQQGEEEDLMVSFGDGKVCRYQITSAQNLKRTQIMATAAAEGTLKGVICIKKCKAKEISITTNDQATCLALHPSDDSTYFVGTSEGVIHKCSTNYYNEHMDLFKAHDGPVRIISFSPFANKIFFTCGDDYRMRLWADGIAEPLFTSQSSTLPFLDVDWSPRFPTVMAMIRSSEIFLYDFQRNQYEPQSQTKSPQNVANTICKFTPNGRCLIIGDMMGNIMLYSLEDMPIPPFFPESLIFQFLKKILITQPDIFKKLKKLGKLNFEKKHYKYFA